MKNKKKFMYKLSGILILVIILTVCGMRYYKHSTDVDSSATKKNTQIEEVQ